MLGYWHRATIIQRRSKPISERMMAYTDPRARRSSDGQRTICGNTNYGYSALSGAAGGGMRPTSPSGAAKATSRQPKLYCVGQQLGAAANFYRQSPHKGIAEKISPFQ